VLEADAVIISAGVVPNSDIAKEAGLAVHERGGVYVDEFMRTNVPDIYAGGDCCIVPNLVTGKDAFLPLGSMANRQGRIIGSNLAGGASKFDGVVGSFVVKLFETSIAGTGLSLDSAKAAGFDAMSVLLIQLDRAHFYPTKELMTLEMVVDKPSRRVLGVQGFGSSGDAMVGRINAVAAILKSSPTIDDVSNMELAYSPPFAAAMDILNTLANLADNALAGINRGVGPAGFKELWDNRDKDACFFMDCREKGDADPFVERNPEFWHNVPQGEIYDRLDEIPKDRPIVLVCNTGARSYEAQIMLDEKGYKDVTNIHGGMAAIKKYGIDL
jgi:rhodanese-related sulfurtransferase